MSGRSDDFNHTKAVLEAALFAAGRPVSLVDIAKISGKTTEEVRALAEVLAEEYSSRKSAIEIRRAGEGYVMQLCQSLATEVKRMAPSELEAPLMRTLAVIAYNQPIKQSELVRIRGNKSYEHVRELLELGLISSEKVERTRLLSTTKAFAEYFGLDSTDPDSIRRVMKRRQKIGVTPMYRSLALRMGLGFVVVNPYSPGKGDLKVLDDLDILIAAPGYSERIKEYYRGEVIEAPIRTFTQAKESISRICKAVEDYGKDDVKALLEEIDLLLAGYRRRAKDAGPIWPMTPMIADVAEDMEMVLDEMGRTVAPDYAQMEADLTVPTHQDYGLDIIERIRQRYEAILQVKDSAGYIGSKG